MAPKAPALALAPAPPAAAEHPAVAIAVDAAAARRPINPNVYGLAYADPAALGTVVGYSWSFGDWATAAGSTASHAYESPGSYTATLVVTDDLGATATASVVVTATGDPGVLSAPTDLAGSSPRKGVARLAWADASSNEEGFYVERGPKSSSSFSRVGETGPSATSFEQAVAKGQYRYRVQAFDLTSGRVSGYSNTVRVTVK